MVGRRRHDRLVFEGHVDGLLLGLVRGLALAGGELLLVVAGRERLREEVAHLGGLLAQEAQVDVGEEEQLDHLRVELAARVGVDDLVRHAGPLDVKLNK